MIWNMEDWVRFGLYNVPDSRVICFVIWVLSGSARDSRVNWVRLETGRDSQRECIPTDNETSHEVRSDLLTQLGVKITVRPNFLDR